MKVRNFKVHAALLCVDIRVIAQGLGSRAESMGWANRSMLMKQVSSLVLLLHACDFTSLVVLVYEGQFANGFEHGEGKKTYSDGSSFEGS